MKQKSIASSVGWQSVTFTTPTIEKSMNPLVADSVYLWIEEAVFVSVYNVDDALDNMVLQHF